MSNIYTTLGASNHTEKERHPQDFYATDPIASELLLEIENLSDVIIDNSYGQGHLMEAMKNAGKKVIGYDIEDRRFESDDVEFHNMNWLHVDKINPNADIVMNPPYKEATEFVEKSLSLLGEGRKLCAFLKVQFLEGKARKKLFEKYPPARIWISSGRILCAKNAEFEKMKAGGGSAVAYAWFVWKEGYIGDTIVKWFN